MTDFTPGRGDRDELARTLDPSRVEGRHIGTAHAGVLLHELQAAAIADVLWAAGWRKKPSRDEVARVLAVSNGWPLDEWEQIITEPISRTLTYWATADAILALLDGPTETGEK